LGQPAAGDKGIDSALKRTFGHRHVVVASAVFSTTGDKVMYRLIRSVIVVVLLASVSMMSPSARAATAF